MEVLKYFWAIVFYVFTVCCCAENNGFTAINEALKDPKNTHFLELEADSASLELFKKNVQVFRHLKGVAILGELEKPNLLWKALAELNLLEYLFFIDNQLIDLKIGGTSSTLKYLWIKNSPELKTSSLNTFMERSNYLISLRLDGVNFIEIPQAIKKMFILKEFQVSNSNIGFKDVMKVIGEKKSIEKLVLSDNNFQLSGKGLKKMTNLKYLNLSGNNLNELPKHLKFLKKLDTLIINRNDLSNFNTVAKQLQLIGLNEIVLDNVPETMQESVSYLLPGKQISWSSYVRYPANIILPAFKQEETIISIQLDATQKRQKQNINSFIGTKNVLSEAYLLYEQLSFPNPLLHFDSTKYQQRYLDSSYVYVEKIGVQNHTKQGEKHKLKHNRKYGGVKKKKKKVKIDHYKDSHVLFHFYDEKHCADGQLIAIQYNQLEKQKRNDLKAFDQYVWLINMSREVFESQFVQQKAWSDLRIDYEDGLFTIKLKGRFESDDFLATLRYRRNPNDLKKIERNSQKQFSKYNRDRDKQEKKFNKSITKNQKKILRPYAKEINELWRKVEAKMSDEEKQMSKYEWRAYYHDLKKDEFAAISKTKLRLAYLARYMTKQGFKEKRSNDFYVGQKWIEATILNGKDSLSINQLCIIDLDQKIVTKMDVKDNRVLLEPFHDIIIYGTTEKGDLFSLNKSEVVQLFDGKTIHIKELKPEKTLPTTAKMYKDFILPIVNNRNY